MARPSCDRRGALSAFGLWMVGLAGLCAIGCDSMSFTPPRPPELSSPAPEVRLKVEAAAAQGLRSIDVILAPRGADAIELLRTAARVQSGLDKVRTRVVEVPGAGPESSAWSERARAVGEVVAEDPLAIVIEAPATPDPDLNKAASEARAQGVLVVALGRSLSDEAETTEESTSTGREIVVVPESFRLSAEILVDRATRNAKNGGLDPKAGALVFVNSTSDPLAGDRAEALREALADAGIETVEELRFAGPDDDGRNKLIEHLKAHPKTAMVLATDLISLDIADGVADTLMDDHPFVIAGYAGDENHARNQTLTSRCAAVGIYSVDRLIRRGINVAAAANRGENVPDRVEILVSMVESIPNAGLPKPVVVDEPGELPTGDSEPEKAEAKSNAKSELKD